MLLSVRKTQDEKYEVFDLDANDKVVADFEERWKAIRFMKKRERDLTFVRAY